ncbi:MAG: hypothetical protein HKN73_00720 [Gemmatimonadetes bacterium]|nr:hypothetical protein [Gemmatimonadota bacterium]
MTLAQLQDIAGEVGIPQSRIAAAAQSVTGVPAARPVPRTFGHPRRVEHVVALPRAPTDDEWERMVVDLREVFDAKGELDGQGNLRTWSHRHLHVHVEPDGDGYRIRLDDANPDVQGMVAAGISCLAAAALFGVLLLTRDVSGNGPAVISTFAGLMAAGGAGLLVHARRSLPRWAHERLSQFAGFGGRTKALLATSWESDSDG